MEWRFLRSKETVVNKFMAEIHRQIMSMAWVYNDPPMEQQSHDPDKEPIVRGRCDRDGIPAAISCRPSRVTLSRNNEHKKEA